MATNLSISIVATAFADDVREAARQSRSAGFGGLVFDAAMAGAQLLELSQTGQREVRHILSSHDQALVALNVRVPAKGFRPEADVEQTLDRLDRVLAAARGLQAGAVCVDLGPLPPAPRQARPKPKISPEQAGLIIIPTAPAEEPEPEPPAPKPDPAFLASLTDALRELGRLADRYSMTVAFRSELAGFASLEQALHAADCPWFGVDLDPVAVLEDEWPLDEVLSRLGPLVRHVRARDAIKGADRRTQPAVIGRGDTNWEELLAALDSSGYHGWITVDPTELADRRAAAMAALNHLSAQRGTA